MDRCEACYGTGFVRRLTPYTCSGKHPDNVVSCMYCENVDKGLYVSCTVCCGTGEKYS
jgi:hypothetical protein